MALELAALLRGKRSPTQHTPQNGTPADGRLPDAVYQRLLGIERKIRKDPGKYNIGEISLEPRTKLDASDYVGQDLQLFEEAHNDGVIELGKPYIASGVIDLNDEGEALLNTTTTRIKLGQLGAHAERMLKTQLAGREMVLPLIIDKVTDNDVEARAGEKAAYLLSNPDWRTRRRLARVGGRADIDGLVRDIDRDTITIQTTPGGRWFRGKSANINLDERTPTLTSATDKRPLKGEAVERQDHVRVPVEFVGDKMVLTGDVSLIAFSLEHEASYNKERESIAKGLALFDSLLNDKDLEQITSQQGRDFDVSEPQTKAAVMRYLFAELRQKQQLLTPAQQEQLWGLVFEMPTEERPFIFRDVDSENTPDPRREILDRYFRRNDFQSAMPKFAEAMTPRQLFYEMMRISAMDDFPPALENIMGLLTDYQGQFEPNADSQVIQKVLLTREEQLRTGTNPEAAMYSLMEALPYLQQTDTAYQTEWLAHLVHAGMSLAEGRSEEWGTSTELHQLMQQCLNGLRLQVFRDEQYYEVNYDALFTLYPFIEYLREWPENLPYSLGEDVGLAYILRDLELMYMAREGRRRVRHHDEGGYSQLTEDRLVRLISGVQDL